MTALARLPAGNRDLLRGWLEANPERLAAAKKVTR